MTEELQQRITEQISRAIKKGPVDRPVGWNAQLVKAFEADGVMALYSYDVVRDDWIVGVYILKTEGTEIMDQYKGKKVGGR